MRLQELLKAYEFDEIFAELAEMYPSAQKDQQRFKDAYKKLLTLRPVASKKQIRYELMYDPETDEEFVGAEDACFNGPWDVLIGKEIKKEAQADLSDLEIAANCLLNVVFIGREPRH